MHKFYQLHFTVSVDFNEVSIDLKNGILTLSPDKKLSTEDEKELYHALIGYLQTLSDMRQ